MTRAQFRAYRVAAGYVRLDWFDGAVVTGQDANETLQAFASLANGRLAPLLMDTRSALSVSREARTLFSGTSHASRVAVYVDSPLSRMIANFYIGMSGPSVPVQLFTDLDDAQRWLLVDPDPPTIGGRSAADATPGAQDRGRRPRTATTPQEA